MTIEKVGQLRISSNVLAGAMYDYGKSGRLIGNGKLAMQTEIIIRDQLEIT